MSGYISGGMDLLMQKSENHRKNKYWTLVYIKEGIGMYLLGTSLRTLNKGDMMILPPHVYYSFESDDLGDEYNENIKAHVMRFDEGWLDDLIKVFPMMSATILRIKEIRNPLAVTGPKWMRIASLFENSAGQPQTVLTLLDQISTGKDVIQIMDLDHHEDCDAVEARKAMIDRYLSCNLCSKVTLEDVASYVGMNRVYFCMFFKAHYKENFTEYLNRRRVELSCRLLSDSTRDIPAIASECGFKTVPYFTRVFSKFMGITPAKYRKYHIFANHKHIN